MRISHTLLTLFNFFNGIDIIIILNKHGELEMGTTSFKSVSLSSLERIENTIRVNILLFKF